MVYVVGGAVRDVLLGETPYDLDLVVEGDAAAFARSLGGALRVHDRFGTSTVKIDPFTYDIARARTETYAHPGALPDVVPATLAEDLLRRDFTVNAMALALDGGQLSAPRSERSRGPRGASAAGPPRRAASPTTRLGCSGSRATRAASDSRWSHVRARSLDEAIRDGALGTLSGPRVGAELRLLAREEDPIAALLAMRELGLDQAIHPRFGLSDEALAPSRACAAPRPSSAATCWRSPWRAALSRRASWASSSDALAFPAHDRDAILAAASRSEDLAARLATGGLAFADRRAQPATPVPSWWPSRARWDRRSRRANG